MNKYLEKIAKEYLNQTTVENNELGYKLGNMAVGFTGTGLAMKYLGPVFQKPVMAYAQARNSIPLDVLDKIKTDVLPRTNTTFDIHEVGGPSGFANAYSGLGLTKVPHYASIKNMNQISNTLHRGGKIQNMVREVPFLKPHVPHYDGSLKSKVDDFKKNYIGMGSFNPDAAIHEMGHAVDFNTGNVKAKHLVSQVGRRLGGKLGGSIGAGLMLSNEKTRDYAWTAPIVASLPTMREEFMANKHGYDLINKHGGKGRSFLPLAAANLLGYAAAPALGAGTVALINHLKRKGEVINPEEYLRDE